MVNLSDTMVRLLNHKDYLETSGVKLLYIFSGAPLTVEDIKTIQAMDPSQDIHTNNIMAFATGRGDTLLQANVYGTDLLPTYPNKKLTQWALSERTEEFRHVNDGTMGWFFFGVSNNSSVNPDASVTDANNVQVLNIKLLTCAFGNAGDEESEADLAILTGEVDGNKEYSTTDLELFYI